MKINFRPGFTIVELLVVIIVIAILAAIIVVSYNGITRQAVESSLRSDIRSAVTVLGIEKTGETRSYPEALGDLVQASEDNTLEYTVDESGQSYCVSAYSEKLPGVAFHASSSNANISEGLCEGHGQGIGDDDEDDDDLEDE